MKAHLVLENGDHYTGAFAVEGEALGELVFTTAYTGYEESLTDPSYHGQGLIFCYPLIGNYGVNEERFESQDVQPNFTVAREFDQCVVDWLQEEDVPAIHQFDTRRLVRAIREEGSMQCAVAESHERAVALLEETELRMTYHPHPSLGYETHGRDGPRIALLDCGVKKSMLEKLSVDAEVIRFPWDTPASTIDRFAPDLLFVSNGPGNPENYGAAINTVRYFDGLIPVAGICLGQQVITLALGGETRKMKFGHRGSNQPVIVQATNRVKMTTQNHSYEVVEKSLPVDVEVTERNVNDDSVEGIYRDGEGWIDDEQSLKNVTPILARQYHPEANPGPNDSMDFFDDVLSLV